MLRDPEPWPHEVDGAALLDELYETLCRFVVLPDGAGEAVALWVLYTHCFDAFDIALDLLLKSPAKRCGKTRLKEVTACLVARPLQVANITGAVLYRVGEKYQPTLLVDEADRFLKESPELDGILNAGHTRDSAYVPRCVGEDFEPRLFSVWYPKLVAGIGRQLDTFEDRAIIVELQRRTAAEKVAHFRLRDKATLQPLQCRCARWAGDHFAELAQSDPETPSFDGNDRAADNWYPLLAIADVAGGSWPERAREAAQRLYGISAAEDGDGYAVLLLGDLRDLFAQSASERLQNERRTAGLACAQRAPRGRLPARQADRCQPPGASATAVRGEVAEAPLRRCS